MMNQKITAAFVGFGEVNTPREIIEKKCRDARKQLVAQGMELICTDPVSDDSAGRDVARARVELAKADFDLLIVCLAGWIPSHAVMGVIDHFKRKPMLLWGLTGWKEGGRFVTTADKPAPLPCVKPCRTWGSGSNTLSIISAHARIYIRSSALPGRPRPPRACVMPGSA